MPANKSDPPSLLNVKPGSCNPSPSHSRRVLEGFTSLLDNLKYCRPREDVQQSLVAARRKPAAAACAGYQSGRSSSSSNSSSSSSSSGGGGELGRKRSRSKQRRSEQLELYRVLPNSGNVGKVPVPEVGGLSHSVDEPDEVMSDLQPVVDELMSSSNDWDKRRQAAEQVKRLAKCNPRAGMALAKMGAVAPLIGMLEPGKDKSVQNSALLALLNLAIGTNVNKAAIVTAGAIPKMVSLSFESTASSSVQENLAGLFLSLSALDVNKPVIGQSGAVPALMTILKQGSLKAKKDALKSLYNLTIFHGNVKVVVDANIIQSLLDMIYHPELVETAVDLLGNLSATEAGRRAIVEKQDAVLILVDVLGWADAPKCQEKAVSVLMTMAHRSRTLRQAIARCGAVAALLELSMLGSSIAQRVASWMLDCLKQDEELGKISKSSALELEEPHPGKFVHRILQQRTTGTREPVTPSCRQVGQDISDHFISITL